MSTNNINLTAANAAKVIAALPGLLGYVPTESFIVVLITTTDEKNLVRAAVRGDITTAPDEVATLPKTAAAAFRGVDSVILIALCGQWNDAHAHTILDTLQQAITAEGIQIRGRLIARDATQPGQWHNIDTNETGSLSPYTDSPMTASRGGDIAPDRHSIVAEFTTPTINRAPICTQPIPAMLIDTFNEVAETVANDSAPSHDLATRAGIIITTNSDLRDTMLLLGVDHPGAAGRLWTALANQLTGRARIAALTIAATFHYLNFDTIRAAIAFELAEDESHQADIVYPRLAQLLTVDLHRGVSPTEAREILLTLIAGRDTD